MRITIEVGEREKCRVEYKFNQLLGTLVITVDNQTVKKSVRLVNEPVLEVHVIRVGKMEHNEVRIEKERKQLLGHRSRLYVNNRLVNVFSGN